MDKLTGVETTGHEWDGVRELNNPLPRWLLYVFYACIVFSIGYMVIYPSIPLGTDYYKGTADYSSRVAVEEDIAAAREAQGGLRERIVETDLADIRSDQQLLSFAVAGGGAAYAENCAPCHGTGANGGPGYPSLQDDAWIWGGTLDAIHTTLQYGIRWEQNDNTRFSMMPAYGTDGILSEEEIDQVAHYVLSLSGSEHDAQAATAGEEIYLNQCAACHMDDGSGMADLGAPTLSDQVWLYGGTHTQIANQIHNPKHGVMPAWEGRLDEATVKMLTVYVHELGGGQ
jgi:cytochrome c oxidase cbb3-type subunit 3